VCELCEKIDARIARYRELSRAIRDKQALESIDRIIADLDAQKRSLHSAA
jgi:hypothetical protein